MRVYSDFHSYSRDGGVYSYSSGSTPQDHVMLLIGYDETDSTNKYFIVKNSWGTNWGEDGFARIAYSEISSDSHFAEYTYAYKGWVYEPFGTIVVNIAAPVPAGAQWRVYGGVWQESGSTLAGLSTWNPHTVQFMDIPGYIKPADVTVGITENHTTTVNAAYIPIANKMCSFADNQAFAEFQNFSLQPYAGSLQTVGSNLVVNGEFESLDGWSISSGTADIVSEGHSSSCLRLTSAPAQTAQQSISGLTIGKLYQFTVWLKAGTEIPNVRLTSGTFQRNNTSQSTVWERLTFAFIAKSTTLSIVLLPNAYYSEGLTTFFDSISLYEVTAASGIGNRIVLLDSSGNTAWAYVGAAGLAQVLGTNKLSSLGFLDGLWTIKNGWVINYFGDATNYGALIGAQLYHSLTTEQKKLYWIYFPFINCSSGSVWLTVAGVDHFDLLSSLSNYVLSRYVNSEIAAHYIKFIVNADSTSISITPPSVNEIIAPSGNGAWVFKDVGLTQMGWNMQTDFKMNDPAMTGTLPTAIISQ